jgi:hypothetical protein
MPGCHRALIASSLLVALSACGGGGDGTTDPPDNQAITVAVSPSSFTIVAGTSENVTVSVTRSGGFEGLIALTVEGAPNGVSATMTPSPIPNGTTSATVTVTALASTVPGTYTITLRATGPGVTAKTATVTLTVAAPPSFSIGATPATQNISQGSTGDVNVAITRSGGFSGAVTLAVQGMPTGMTMATTPNPTTLNAATLTLSVGPAVTAGVHNLTVRGTATGLPDATASVAVTVVLNEGSFSLSLTPNALNITQGLNAQTTVNIARVAPFAGNVTLALEGAPNGITHAFVDNPTGANSSQLTITVGAGVAPGPYNLTVRGTVPGFKVEDDVLQPAIAPATVALTLTVAVAGDYTLSATSPSIAQGSGGTSTVNVNRNGGFSGNVQLTLEGAPAGVTHSFAPNPATGTSSTLSLTVGGAVPVNTYNLAVRGTTPGLADQTAQFVLTVTAPGSFTLSAAPTLTLAQGADGQHTININRTGGFAGSVSFSHTTNAPGAVTFGYSSNPTTGNSTTLTINVGGSVTPGSYTITVRGNATGVPEQSTVITLTVTAIGGGNVTWAFCAQTGVPVWLAVQDGNGAWTAVSPNSGSYNFTITTKGAVAWVIMNGGKASLMITYGSLAELQANGPTCVGSGGAKTLNAKITNMPPGQFAFVSVGGGFRTINASDVLSPVTGVREGSVDALVTTSVFFPPSVGRGLIRRGFNLADGATMPDFDMTGGESFAFTPRTVTFSNTAAGTLMANVSYITAGGGFGLLYNPVSGDGSNTVPFYTVPAPAPGDLHMLAAIEAQGAASYRTVTKFFNASADQSVTLGDFAPALTNSFTTAGYVRPRAQFTNSANLNRMWTLNWSNRGGTQNSVLVQVWEGSGMGTAIDYQVPDFSGTAGWLNSYGLQAGTGFPTDVILIANGWTIGTAPGQQPRLEGGLIFTAGRNETISP